MQTASQNYYNNGLEYTNDNKHINKDNLKVVNNKQNLFKNQKRLMFKALFMIAIVLVVGVGFVAYGTSIKYQINETNVAINKLQTEIDNLNLQLTALTSPGTIEAKAINELGMEYPSASQYVYINSGSGIVYTADAE